MGGEVSGVGFRTYGMGCVVHCLGLTAEGFGVGGLGFGVEARASHSRSSKMRHDGCLRVIPAHTTNQDI